MDTSTVARPSHCRPSGVGPAQRLALRVWTDDIGDRVEHCAELRLAVAGALNGLPVHPERDVVDEHPAVYLGQVDDALATVDERVESANHVVTVDAEIQREMVARARGHARVWQRMLGGDCRHHRLRPVAAGHGERIGTARHRVTDELLKVRARRQLDRLDPARPRLGRDMEALGLTPARARVVEEHGSPWTRSGRELDTCPKRGARGREREQQSDDHGHSQDAVTGEQEPP